MKHIFAAAAFGLLAASTAQAQTYPTRAVSFVVPSSAGSPSDMIARHVAQSFAAQTKSAVVTDDKPGANGIIGVQAVLNAPADGHTVLFTTMSPIVLNKFLFKSLPYDAQADLIPVGLMARSTMWLAVNPKHPFKTAKDLVDYAKREPSKLNYGYGTAVPQLAGSMFQQLTGARFTFVPYKAHTNMVTALMSGEIDVSITDTASLAQYVKAGQVRPLASTAAARLPAYPDIPTLRELGIGYELAAWHGLFVKRGTPPEVIARLAELLKVAARTSELQAYLSGNGLDNYLVTGAEAPRQVGEDFKRWEKITRDAGVVPN